MCADNPWRVVVIWIAIIASLIFLVATIGGSLRDEFSIPGSDTQKATDLIEAGILVRAGRRPQHRVRGAGRGAARHSGRKAAILKAIALLKTVGVQATGREGGPHQRRRPVHQGHVLRTDALPTPKRSSTRRSRTRTDRRSWPCRRGPADRRARRDTSSPTARPSSRRSSRALRVARPAGGDHRAALRLPHVRGDADPDRARDRGADDGLPVALHPRHTDINTVTPILVSMIGLGVGIDYSLFIVTRFRQLLHGLEPRVAAAEAGSSAGRECCSPVSRSHLVAGLAFLGSTSDAARDRERARRAHDRAHRELAPDRRPRAPRPQGRSAQGAVHEAVRRLGGGTRQTLIARWGRFVTRNAKVVFPVLLIAGFILAGHLRICASAPPTRERSPTQTSRRAYDLLAEGFGAGFNGPIRS